MDGFAIPEGVPQTHFGVATDGKRYIYTVGGQIGPHCSPCTDSVYVYDTVEGTWDTLQSLPEKRYVGVAHLWHDRLHVIAGSKEDRNTPSSEHWSIHVKDGRFLEAAWREETPIPRGGMHRGSVILDDLLYIVGGVEGDIRPIAGHPQFHCDWQTPPEHFHGEVYRLHYGAQDWERLENLPVPIGHSDTTTVAAGAHILLCGGTSSRVTCTDIVYIFDTKRLEWSILGKLPHLMKSSFAVVRKGRLYLFTGQRSVSRSDARPRHTLNSVWSAKLAL